MKKAGLLLCVQVMLLLAACGKAPEAGKSSGEAAAENKTSEIVLEKQPLNYFGEFAETPDGYYYGLGPLLYYCPRGGSRFVPVCGKPNCKHNDRNCNAYLPVRKPVEAYDGAIYTGYDALDSNDCTKYFPDGIGFAKRNLDGTEHAPVSFDLTPYVRDGLFPRYSWCCYQGKAYLMLRTSEELPIEQQEDHLIVVDLADGSSTELAEAYFREHRMEKIKICNGKLCACASKNKGPEHNAKEWFWAELDLTSGEVTEFPINERCACYVTDTTVFFFELDGDDCRAERPGFNAYDRATGTVREFGMPVDEKNVSCLLYDSDYIYLCTEGEDGEKGTLYILSGDYQVVDQLSLRRNQKILSVTSDCVFLQDPDAAKDPVFGQDCAMICVRKSQIGSHNLKPEKMEIMIPNVDWVELRPGESQA